MSFPTVNALVESTAHVVVESPAHVKCGNAETPSILCRCSGLTAIPHFVEATSGTDMFDATLQDWTAGTGMTQAECNAWYGARIAEHQALTLDDTHCTNLTVDTSVDPAEYTEVDSTDFIWQQFAWWLSYNVLGHELHQAEGVSASGWRISGRRLFATLGQAFYNGPLDQVYVWFGRFRAAYDTGSPNNGITRFDFIKGMWMPVTAGHLSLYIPFGGFSSADFDPPFPLAEVDYPGSLYPRGLRQAITADFVFAVIGEDVSTFQARHVEPVPLPGWGEWCDGSIVV